MAKSKYKFKKKFLVFIVIQIQYDVNEKELPICVIQKLLHRFLLLLQMVGVMCKSVVDSNPFSRTIRTFRPGMVSHVAFESLVSLAFNVARRNYFWLVHDVDV
jgi:hypothetical protein